MNLIKKITSLLLVITLMVPILLNTPAFASSNEKSTKLKLNHLDRERLRNLGFFDDEIDNMDAAEYLKFHGLTGVKEEENENYYKVTKSGPILVTKETALEAVKKDKERKEKGDMGTYAENDTEQLSWMKMTTVVIRLYDSYGKPTGEVQLKNSFTWLTNPNWTLVDTLGLSHSTNLTQISNSEFAKLTWDDGVGTHNENYYTANKKNYSGMAFKIDIRGVGTNAPAVNNRGYMYFKVKRNSTGVTSSNAYGHYIHVYYTSSYSISITTGDISLSGVAQEKHMTDTGINWNW